MQPECRMWISRRQTMKPKMQRRPARLLGSSLGQAREIYLRAPRSQGDFGWEGLRLTRQMTMRTGHPVVKETIRGLGRVLPDSHQVKGGLGLSHKLGVSPVVALSSEQASRNSFVSCPFSPDCDSASPRPSPCSPLSLLARSTFFVAKCRLRRLPTPPHD